MLKKNFSTTMLSSPLAVAKIGFFRVRLAWRVFLGKPIKEHYRDSEVFACMKSQISKHKLDQGKLDAQVSSNIISQYNCAIIMEAIYFCRSHHNFVILIVECSLLKKSLICLLTRLG